jgi:hypothetical protein
MKKLGALSIVLLLVAGGVFAQIPDGFTVGGWGRAVFVPIQGSFTEQEVGGETVTTNKAWSGVGSGWNSAYTGVHLRYIGEKVGGNLGLGVDGTNINFNDDVGIWAKPFGNDLLKIHVGKFRDGVLRGPGTDGNWQGYIGGPGKNGDAVFQRFQPDGGALFFSKPIPALSVYFQVDPGVTTLSSATEAATDAEDTWKRIQAGIGYSLDGIGLARVQYVGGTNKITPGGAAKWEFDPATYDGSILVPTGTEDVEGWKYIKATDPSATPSRVEAAFKFTMIEGLTADLGAKIPFPVKDDSLELTYQDNIQINLAGSFTAGDFGITYGIYSGFGGNWKPDSGDASNLSPTFNLLLVPSYYLAAIDAKVGADLGLMVVGDSTKGSDSNKDGNATFGGGLWVERNLGKGSIKTGVVYLAAPVYTDADTGKGKDKTGYFTLPVILEVSF